MIGFPNPENPLSANTGFQDSTEAAVFRRDHLESPVLSFSKVLPVDEDPEPPSYHLLNLLKKVGVLLAKEPYIKLGLG